MNGNGNGTAIKLLVAALALVGSFLLGSMSTWISASDRFVTKADYEQDVARLERKIDRLLEFHTGNR